MQACLACGALMILPLEIWFLHRALYSVVIILRIRSRVSFAWMLLRNCAWRGSAFSAHFLSQLFQLIRKVFAFLAVLIVSNWVALALQLQRFGSVLRTCRQLLYGVRGCHRAKSGTASVCQVANLAPIEYVDAIDFIICRLLTIFGTPLFIIIAFVPLSASLIKIVEQAISVCFIGMMPWTIYILNNCLMILL